MFILALIALSLSFYTSYSLNALPFQPQKEKKSITLATNYPKVLAATAESQNTLDNFTFRVSSPSFFTEGVTFEKDIVAPNVVYSVNGDVGDVEIALTAGTGISVDGFTITNTGITSLTAGTGISVSGSTISTNLSAGSGISISGATISSSVDLTASGWTNGTDVIYLTTLTDSVGIGTASPTSALHVVGTTNLAGAVTLGTSSSDTITVNGSISTGSSIIPSNDLGSDLGSSSKRFNNIWAANVNSNSSQSFSGQTTFSYAPTAATLTTGSVIINPTSSYADGQLLGLGIAGYQRALIDEDGDIILGYSDQTSAPVTDYPLNIYGHSGTRVAYVDTSGNLGLATGAKILPASNSTTALNIANAAGTSFVTFDSTNSFVGIGTTPSYTLHVSKDFSSSNGTLAYFAFKDSSTVKARVSINNTGSNRNPDILLDGWDNRGYIGANGTLYLYPYIDIIGNTSGESYTSTSGTINAINASEGFAPTSGTAVINYLNASPTINQTGGASGITRGLYIAPTLTSAADWRSIEVASGNVLFNTTSGSVGIGTTSPTSKFHLTGATTGKALAIFNETGDQAILTASVSGSTKLVLSNSGYLGIGSSNTAYPLDIWDSTKQILQARTDGTQTELIGFRYSDNSSGLIQFSANGYNFPSNGGNTRFGGATNHFDISGDGYLSLRKPSPKFKFIDTSSSGNGFNLELSSANLSIKSTENYDQQNQQTRFYIANSTGNIGIGTTSPTSLLHISGAVTGKALAIFNETGDQALLTASSSGTTKFTVNKYGLVDGTSGGLATYVKAGTISDTDFTDTAVNGLMGFDSTNGRLYIRNGGSWSYIAKTAGFQIPDYEAVGLTEGDFLMPYVEYKMSDGGVHGLYSKWSDVKNQLLSDIYTFINSINAQITQLKEKLNTKEVCLKDDSGETCITKEKLDQLLNQNPTTVSPTATTAPVEQPTTTPEAIISSTPTPSPIPTPIASEAPSL